jgi:exosortase
MATFANRLRERNTAPSVDAQISWMGMAWFGTLLIACYAPILLGLARQWAMDADVGHGFFVPLVSGYIAWTRRGQLARAKRVPNYWGLGLVALGAFQLLLGSLAAQIFIARTALLVSLGGAILFLGGSRMLKILAFPLLLLLFMIPIPAIVYAPTTLPLQILASSIAENLLSLAGIPVLRDGNILELANQRLSVVEACSGIRSLLSLGFLSLIYAYFFDKRVWMRGVLLAATVPIAIAANASRVALMGVLSDSSPELTRGSLHPLEGWVLFLIALTLVIGAHQLASRIHGVVKRSPAQAMEQHGGG